MSHTRCYRPPQQRLCLSEAEVPLLFWLQRLLFLIGTCCKLLPPLRWSWQSESTLFNGWAPCCWTGVMRPVPTSRAFVPACQVVWTGEAGSGGFLSVVDGVVEGAKYRLLKADHSVLGGVYLEPEEFAGQSIYDIFYLQEAVRYCSRRPTLSPFLMSLSLCFTASDR